MEKQKRESHLSIPEDPDKTARSNRNIGASDAHIKWDNEPN